jgi:predicted DNA-binding transcriptional regulator YafY
MEVYITPELKMSILSYGDQVKVLKPNALQKEIAETLGNTLKHYQ